MKLTLDLAARIKALRLERGWSQADLAKRIDATEHFVYALENDNVNLTVIMLEKLAAVFNVRLTVELG